MQSFSTSRGLVTLGIGLLFALGGCGGATNNDQGVSFTLLGFRADSDNCDQPVANQSGTTAPLSQDTEATGGLAGAIIAGAVVQNNLTAQFVRTEHIFFTYFVPGASTQPPATSSVLGAVVGQAVTDEDGTVTPGKFCGEVFIVPAEVMNWINLNRTSLPELPFTMEVTASVTGITSAGDRLDTNDIKYVVQFTPDVIVPPTEGDGSEGDTDGDTGDDTGASTAGDGFGSEGSLGDLSGETGSDTAGDPGTADGDISTGVGSEGEI